MDFRSSLQDVEAFRRLVAGIHGQPPGRPDAGAVPPHPAVCPYRGLAVFGEADAPFFFGREADTQHLLEQLRTQRFLAVIGPSGSGKSSFVRAGVLPKLRQGALPGSEGWTYLVFKPGARPLDELNGQLINGSALIDANQQIQGPEKHHKSSGLLASFMMTLFTVWV